LQAADSTFPPVSWLSPEKNPYGVPVVDCRAFSRVMHSVTSDAKVVESYMRLRSSTGKEHSGQSPPRARLIPCKLRYPWRRMPADGPLFRAEAMEDKWDIYLYDGFLYFARSWNGDLIFRTAVQFANSEAKVTALEACEDVAADAELTIQQVDFLIKSHVLRLEVPHPLPANFPDDTTKIAAYSFNLYGRQASYATYADTTAFGRQRLDPDATLPV